MAMCVIFVPASRADNLSVVPALPAPINTVLPALSSDTAQVGTQLNASTGTWTDTLPLTYTYQWDYCNRSGANCAPITGATDSTYNPQEGDIGLTLEVVVTADDGANSAAAASEFSNLVAGPAPVNTVAPALSSPSAVVGTQLTVSTGTWTTPDSSNHVTYSYLWEDCDAQGDNCSAIPFATGASYTPQTSDIGSTLEVLVTANNSRGRTPESTTASDVVVAAVDPDPVTPPFTPPVVTPPVSEITPPVVEQVPVLVQVPAAVAPRLTTYIRVARHALTHHVVIVNAGIWTGTGPLGYKYQWKKLVRDHFVNIPGASQAAYRLTSRDKEVVAVVTVTGPGGSTQEVSRVLVPHKA
jgi:hypothetical protein